MKNRIWILLLISVCLASCSTLTSISKALSYKKPAWGLSKNPVHIADIQVADQTDGSDARPLVVSIVPAQNAVLLQLGNEPTNWEFPDQWGSLDQLKSALLKFQEWKAKLDGTGATVNKEIGRADVWMFRASRFQYDVQGAKGKYHKMDDAVFVVFSLTTAPDLTYQCQIKFMVLRPKGNYLLEDSPVDVNDPEEAVHENLNQEQVASLLSALDESDFQEKANAVDTVEQAEIKAEKDKLSRDQAALQDLK